jgi:hypothetical protein
MPEKHNIVSCYIIEEKITSTRFVKCGVIVPLPVAAGLQGELTVELFRAT